MNWLAIFECPSETRCKLSTTFLSRVRLRGYDVKVTFFRCCLGNFQECTTSVFYNKIIVEFRFKERGNSFLQLFQVENAECQLLLVIERDFMNDFGEKPPE